MSEHNEQYIKLAGNAQYWAVDDDERYPVKNMEHLYSIGLRAVITVTKDEMEAIPIKGAKVAKRKKAVS